MSPTEGPPRSLLDTETTLLMHEHWETPQNSKDARKKKAFLIKINKFVFTILFDKYF